MTMASEGGRKRVRPEQQQRQQKQQGKSGKGGKGVMRKKKGTTSSKHAHSLADQLLPPSSPTQDGGEANIDFIRNTADVMDDGDGAMDAASAGGEGASSADRLKMRKEQRTLEGQQKRRKRQEEGDVLEASMTSKILRQARQQQQEVAREEAHARGLLQTQLAFDVAAKAVARDRAIGDDSDDDDDGGDEDEDRREGGPAAAAAGADSSDDEKEDEEDVADVLRRGRHNVGREKEEEEEDGQDEAEDVAYDEEEGEDEGASGKGRGGWDTYSDSASQYEDYALDVTEEDERAMAVFLAPTTATSAGQQRTLADIIMERIRKSEAQAGVQGGGGGGEPSSGMGVRGSDGSGELRTVPGLDEKVHAVYRGVGELLSRYTTGKIPKAFKIVPSLANWEEVLFLTSPEKWSPHAVFAATRLFASNLNSRMAQRFYRLVLLPRVRNDIRTHKRLHFALYQALKKAVYKPSAFYKGILLPLCQSGSCSLREAVIVGSILQKVSIPVLHSSVALMKIAQMPYAGTNSYFLKLFFDKKYALPYRVVDAVVDHYVRLAGDERELPVIWHQSLLAFVQRYKNELTMKGQNDIKAVLNKQHHHLVSPEVMRELNSATHARDHKHARPPSLSGSGHNMPAPQPITVIRKPLEESYHSLPQVAIGMEEDGE